MSQRGVNCGSQIRPCLRHISKGCKLVHHFLHTPSQAHKDKLCRDSAGSGPSLETIDVTLVRDDGKRLKAHKDRLCRGSADSDRELIVQSLKHVQPSKPSC